ncbi:ovarian cancer G-protein coupled receptor 1 [Protopterus annectens]|uniref:ovarian cancer G-protein coupled receptor 1 n=1 Tax=Protopterus annectens TaxID=7888 RepID=UPI001CFA4088|nr:ovarian cancer G-protein coupled receptor 1 [Protopterus annectens]XP_043930648.1 ovarian cancer G-protein coupled receptor 1 [Protopterus annectens]
MATNAEIISKMGAVLDTSEDTNATNCTLDHSMHTLLFPAVYIAVFAIGLPSNLFVLYYGFTQIKAKNVVGVYLCNLTLSDVLYILSLPFWTQYLLQDDNWTYNELLCKICGCLLYENIYITTAFLCCIAIDRYLAVVHPLHFYHLRTIKAAVIISILVWLKELVVVIVLSMHNEIINDKNNSKICFERYPLASWQYNINMYRVFVGFLLPLVLLTFSYSKILYTIKKSTGAQQNQKEKISRLVFCTVFIFVFFFSPYHIVLLIRSILEKDCPFAEKIFKYYHLLLLVTSLNCVADPFLYCFASESTRNDLVRLKNSFLKLFACQKKKTLDSSQTNRQGVNTSETASMEVLG